MEASLKTTDREDFRYLSPTVELEHIIPRGRKKKKRHHIIVIKCRVLISVTEVSFAGGGMSVPRRLRWEVLRQSCRCVSWTALFQRGAVPLEVRSQPVHLWRVSR